MAFHGKTIAFIGAGVMGEAMIRGLLHQELLTPSQIIAADPHAGRLRHIENAYGIRCTGDNLEAAVAADVLVLSIKPQVMSKALSQLRGHVADVSLIISIAAGVPLQTIAEGSGNKRVVRSMPNTPAQIGVGITVWTASPAVDKAGREQTELVLGAMGERIYAEDERFLDMATALGGSGPAYVFLFMEALIDAGVHMGFSRRDAELLVTQTLHGSVIYARESGLHPAQLRNQVTSPGGTTAAALHEMEKGGLRTVLSQGVWAAYRRSRELGEKEG